MATAKPKQAEKAQRWLDAIDKSRRRMASFRTTADRAERQYLSQARNEGVAEDASLVTEVSSAQNDNRLPSFVTNIRTLSQYLRGKTIKVNVRREYADPGDDLARVGSNLYKRTLSQQEDMAKQFQAAMKGRLIAGMGVARVRYVEETHDEPMLDGEGKPVLDNKGKPVMTAVLDSEDCRIEYIPPQDFLYSPARKWDEVTWVAFRLWMDKPSVMKRFPGYENKLEYSSQSADAGIYEEETANEEESFLPEQAAEIWELWSKKDQKVYWVATGCDTVLDTGAGYGLDDFFPCCSPMMANVGTKRFLPRSDYAIYRPMLDELNQIQARIKDLREWLKARGWYDSALGEDFATVLSAAADGFLMPVDDLREKIIENGGDPVLWAPLEGVINALQQLIPLRDRQIDLVNEAMGVSDLMRGADGDPRQSATASGLKAKSGSMLVAALKDEYAEFATALARLKAEIIAKHFADQTILEMSNAKFLPEADRELIMPAMALMRSPDAGWRIDISADSLSYQDIARQQEERDSFLEKLGKLMPVIITTAQETPHLLPMTIASVKYALAAHPGSNELEGIVDELLERVEQEAKAQAQQPQADPAQAAAQAEMALEQQKAQLEMEKAAAAHQHKLAEIAAQAEAKAAEEAAQGNAAIAQAQQEADIAVAEHARKLAMDKQHAQDLAEIEIDKARRMPKPQAQAA